MNGIVISAHLNNYKVKTQSGIYETVLIGNLRKNKIIVGDKVLIKINKTIDREDLNTIIKVFPRKNEFNRPHIANIDNIFIITSSTQPKLNDFHLDKLITSFQFQNVNPILIFSKIDLLHDENVKEIIQEYKDLGYQTFLFSNKFEISDIKKLEKLTNNKLNALTGHTGVGKSTIINFLSSSLNLRTQEISKFLGRGKHTTTGSQIYEIFENSLFIDTPGFSSLELEMSKIDIAHNFLTFSQYLKSCKFSNCLHLNENGCNVKSRYSTRKYDNYKKISFEAKK